MKSIVLASASPRRSDLLRQIGVDFRVLPSNIEEVLPPGMHPGEAVEELALKKALSVSENLKDGSLVIGADTIVVKDTILGKPCDEHDALRMLHTLEGDSHEVLTGVAVVDLSTMKYIKGFEKTKVFMKSLTDEKIKAYIDTGEPMDKAGAYGIQGKGALLVEKIEGCYFNVVGLPLGKLSEMLEYFGVKVM
ncbi:MAG TPA: Maf family protein [Clostridia bacterium]